jgi:uncharacterized membrane protein HdeD (DUF308 family)
MVALRGVAAVLFGIVAIAWPDITVGVLVAFFGALALVDGALSIGAAISGPSTDRWWYVIRGLFGSAVGIIAWVWPGVTVSYARLHHRFVGSVAGIAEVAAAISLRERITDEWVFALSGAVSILIGIVLFAFPGEGAIALVTTLGIFAVVLGGALVGCSLSLRQLSSRSTRRGTGMAGAPGC